LKTLNPSAAVVMRSPGTCKEKGGGEEGIIGAKRKEKGGGEPRPTLRGRPLPVHSLIYLAESRLPVPFLPPSPPPSLPPSLLPSSPPVRGSGPP
jgi:hypothetical protein